MNKQEYLLVVLAEECAEVAKACSKALRFRMDKYKPGECDESNKEHIERELAEVVAVAELLGLKINDEHKRDKVGLLEHYMEVSRKLGTLDKAKDESPREVDE